MQVNIQAMNRTYKEMITNNEAETFGLGRRIAEGATPDRAVSALTWAVADCL